MKKILSLLVSLSVAISLTVGSVSAQGESPAEKAIQGVKEKVGELIEAKDKNDPKEAEARLETYKKVLTLALSDAKGLKLKLLAFEEDKTTTTLTLWKRSRVEAVNEVIKYYENEEALVAEMAATPAEEVKARAEELKSWRESTYLPLADEIQAFLLIEQQKKSLDIATKRLQKIGVDVEKLKKAKFKEIKTVEEQFGKSGALMNEAIALNNEAEHRFQRDYLLPFMGKDDPLRIALLKEIKEEKEATEKAKKVPVASSTPPIPPLSIKELVDRSFTKVKDAYQIFIEMSSLVRKLL